MQNPRETKSQTPSDPAGTLRKLCASTAAVLLTLVGLVIPVSAGAAGGPSLTTAVTVTGASAADGLDLVVSGSNYTALPAGPAGPAAGVYVALRATTMTDAQVNADTSLPPALTFLPKVAINSGNWTTALHADTADLDPDADYEVIVWTAHGPITPASKLDTIPVTFTTAQHEALFPTSSPTTTTTTTTSTTTPPTTTVPPVTHPWSTTVTVTGATAADGLSLQVQGTGYTALPAGPAGPAAGVYVALRATTMTDAQVNADTSLPPALTFLPSAAISSGNWTTVLNAAAADLDPHADYEVIVWTAHGPITPASKLDTIPLTLTAAQKRALFGGSGPTPTTAPPTTRPAPPTSPATTQPRTQRSAAVDDAGLYCITETTAGTTGTPQLQWGVKSSFVNYIEGNIAKGRITTGSGVVRSVNTFTWTSGSGSLDGSGQGTWTFPGSIHFTGHDNVLNTTLANLRIRVDGPNHGVLIADVDSQDMNGNDVGGASMTVAELNFSSVSASGGTASVTLTAAGAQALNSMYEAGESMDPLTVSVSGGTSGSSVENCYDAQGNLVSSTPTAGNGQLPATGFGAARLAVTGVLMALLGMLAVVIATRRRRAHLAAP